jgi:hypothetical protein
VTRARMVARTRVLTVVLLVRLVLMVALTRVLMVVLLVRLVLMVAPTRARPTPMAG